MTRAHSQSAELVQAVDDHGRRVQAMFSDIAHGYDRANRLMSLGTDARWRRLAVELLVPKSVEDRAKADGRPVRILDLCAGTLDSTLAIHRRYPEAELVGGDFSAGMLAEGRRRLDGTAARRITAVQMDAHELPEPDHAFDGLFCAFGIRNVSNLPRATAEMSRVLRPGGRLVILEFFRPTRPLTRFVHAIYNRTVLPIVGWACTGNLGAYLYLPRSITGFTSAQDYQTLLGVHGFRDVKVRHLAMGVASIIVADKAEEETSKR